MSEEQIPISQAIEELEQYRQRLIDDTLAIAKKVKANKKVTLDRLDQHPEILEIDQRLATLRSKQAAVSKTSPETMQLSERAKQLIPKARIVSFAYWEGKLSAEAISLFQKADDEGRYLTNEDFAALQKETQIGGHWQIAQLLRDRASEIVTEAREQVLAGFPNIAQPGGDLYPPERAEACWRDFWHFLRCVTYGIAGGHSQFTSNEGLHAMNLLYQELNVPLSAMVLGLETLKVASLKNIGDEKIAEISAYFDHLIEQLKKFS